MLELQKKYHEARMERDKEIYERQIKIVDAQIDRLVYDLYGLTEEDVKVIQGERNDNAGKIGSISMFKRFFGNYMVRRNDKQFKTKKASISLVINAGYSIYVGSTSQSKS